jgi:hypothetical protein
MVNSPVYDGVLEENNQGAMSSEGQRARSDAGLKEIQRRGDLPNASGPIGGEQRMGLSRYDADPAAGVAKFDDLQSGPKSADTGELVEVFYDELERYNAERAPVTTGWKTTEDSPLPQSRSKEFPFGRDVPEHDAEPGKVPPILEPDSAD